MFKPLLYSSEEQLPCGITTSPYRETAAFWYVGSEYHYIFQLRLLGFGTETPSGPLSSLAGGALVCSCLAGGCTCFVMLFCDNLYKYDISLHLFNGLQR